MFYILGFGATLNSYIFSALHSVILMRFNAFIIGWLLLSLPFSCIRMLTTFMFIVDFWPLTKISIYYRLGL